MSTWLSSSRSLVLVIWLASVAQTLDQDIHLYNTYLGIDETVIHLYTLGIDETVQSASMGSFPTSHAFEGHVSAFFWWCPSL